MKRIYTCLAFLCLLFTFVAAQTPLQHEISRLPERYNYRLPSQNEKNIDIPGKGRFQRIDMDVKQLNPQIRSRVGKGLNESSPGHFPLVVHSDNEITTLNPLIDARNLPLSENNKLLNPNGQEVDFVIPNNPNEPGICATPTPYVNLSNERVMANCAPSVACDLAVNRDANIPLPADPLKYFKLNFTVLLNTANGASSNINQVGLDAIVAELNADFLPFRIQFCSDPANFVTDDALYNLNAGTEDASLKTTYGTTPQDWINIYVVGNITNPSAGGYARFPYDPFGGFNIRGGVVLASGNMFLGTHTLAHELGHTFGLYHTFHGVDEVTPCTNCYEGRDLLTGGSSGGDTEGDWCSDTNPHATNANICGDFGSDGCPPNLAWLNSPVNNHMSYSFCTTQFTPQQAGRMHCMIDTYLGNWVAFGGATCGAQPPVANFTATPTIWNSPCNVVFTDLSVPSSTITNWTWNFDVSGIGGVTPATFVGQTPPTVEYTICDTQYTVSLTVTNPNGSDTETKVDYITVNCPALACDTLFSHWNTPVSSNSIYTFAAGDYVTGVPALTLNGNPPAPVPVNNMGLYEMYITPNPGVTTVGAVEIAMGAYLDPDSNTVFQVVVYNCDATGFPDPAPIGGAAGINPGRDLGVPAGLSFLEYWIPFNKVTIDSANFLVAVEIFPGDPTDELSLISSDGFPGTEGQGLGLNFFNSSLGYGNYLGFVGLDFDLHLVPMLGQWQAETYITGLFQSTGCDTTLVLLTDTTLYQECMTSMTFTSSYAGSITDTTATTLDSLFILYLQAPPDTITFETINECGRTDSFSFAINYTFDTTPNPDFVVNLPNPVCASQLITYTATPAGMTSYTWDFGDGNTSTSGLTTTTHSYASPGLYYVTLVVTDASGCQGEITKLDLIEVVDCSVNAPIAGFDPTPDTSCIGDPFTFTDTSQAVPDPPTGWFWAFDDGTFSLQQNPIHSYANAGTYTVMLVASNAGGTDTIYFDVEVLPNPCVLPIGIELHANPVDQSVVLAWETPSDASRPLYEIERGIDGVSFSQVGSKNWDEYTSPHLYSFIDHEVVAEQTMYYRIKQIGQNGEVDFSNVAIARITAGSNSWLNVYPNPVVEGQQLNIDAFLLEAELLNISMVDVLGRVVYSQSIDMPAGIGRKVLPTDQIPAGTYFIRVSGNKRNEVAKIVIE